MDQFVLGLRIVQLTPLIGLKILAFKEKCKTLKNIKDNLNITIIKRKECYSKETNHRTK